MTARLAHRQRLEVLGFTFTPAKLEGGVTRKTKPLTKFRVQSREEQEPGSLIEFLVRAGSEQVEIVVEVPDEEDLKKTLDWKGIVTLEKFTCSPPSTPGENRYSTIDIPVQLSSDVAENHLAFFTLRLYMDRANCTDVWVSLRVLQERLDFDAPEPGRESKRKGSRVTRADLEPALAASLEEEGTGKKRGGKAKARKGPRALEPDEIVEPIPGSELDGDGLG